MDVCGLESRAGDRLNGRGVQREPVVRQPGAPDAAETPPKEVFRAILLDEERVDRVQTADLLADEQLAVVMPGSFGRLGLGDADAAVLDAAPRGERIVEQIAVADHS